MQEDSATFNLEQALGILRRRVLLVALCVLVVGGAAYAYSKHQAKKYTTSASLTFSNNQLSQQVAGLQAVATGNPLAQQASNIERVRLGDMAAKTAKVLGHGLTALQVANALSISGQGESSVVSVSATTTSPVLSAEIANTYVREFAREQKVASQAYFKSATDLVAKQLRSLEPKQRTGIDGLKLQDRLQSLGLLAKLDFGGVQVAQEAPVPVSASSPKTGTNTILGCLIGLVVGLALAFLLERLDRRVRQPGELEQVYGLPTLGLVPKSRALARPARDVQANRVLLQGDDGEAFRLIRARLRYLGLNRSLRAILVVSADLGEGNTTVARHLAATAARMGSRVLLLEADLRRPALAGRLALEPGPGLADVLIGAITVGEAIQSIQLGAPDGAPDQERTLDVLTAGSITPANPAELIESPQMEGLLAQVKFEYDLVVIDVPPLTTVSDAFPLLAHVDGVAIVGRIGHSAPAAPRHRHQLRQAFAQRHADVCEGPGRACRRPIDERKRTAVRPGWQGLRTPR